MQTSAAASPIGSRLQLQLARFSLAVFLMVILAAIPGCPGAPQVTNLVTGKVTLGGKRVEGIVSFIGADNKSVDAPIGPDGVYNIANPPMGKVKITVKPAPGLAAGVGGAVPQGAAPVGGELKGKGGKEYVPGVPPPAKYATPDNGLTYEVKGGKEEKNLQLSE